MPKRKTTPARTTSAPEGAALTLYAAPQDFARWLDAELFRRFGRVKSNRSICIEAGLPENALYRVLTAGERPSAPFIERMVTHLDIPRDKLERHAGLRPLLEIGTDGRARGGEALAEDERQEARRVLRAALDTPEPGDGG